MPGGKVDDAKAAHAEADPALREEAVVIRAAVGYDVAHAPQDAGIDMCLFAELKYSRDPTHSVIAPDPTKVQN
jgi:hypothetical protein